MNVGKVIAGVVLLALVAVGGLIGWLSVMSPDSRPAPDITIERTPERVARGKYLVEHVFDCTGCHSDQSADWAASTIDAWYPDRTRSEVHYGEPGFDYISTASTCVILPDTSPVRKRWK